MARWIGLAIDNLISASIVLANGDIVEATIDGEHSDLFWAIRGGGGNFGVIVSFTLKGIKVGWDQGRGPGRLLAGVRVVRHSNGGATCCGNGIGAVAVFCKWRDYALYEAPDHVSCDCILPTGMCILVLFEPKT
jgi:hypothetical protein